MARPMKDGVEYFPLDVDFLQDDKIRLIKAEFGSKGILIVIALLCDIYRTNGYYKVWDKDACLLMADAVGCGVVPENITQVVHGCLRRSIFDDGVFQVFGILTSAGIQRRYIRAVSTRDQITIFKEYWLLNMDDKKDVPTGVLNKVIFKTVNSEENRQSLKKTPVKTEINSQSRVKKSRVKESRGDVCARARKENSLPLIEYRNMFIKCCPSLLEPAPVKDWPDERKRAIQEKDLTPQQMEPVLIRAESSGFLTGRCAGHDGEF